LSRLLRSCSNHCQCFSWWTFRNMLICDGDHGTGWLRGVVNTGQKCCILQKRQRRRGADHCANHCVNLFDISARDAFLFHFFTGGLGPNQSLEQLRRRRLLSQRTKEKPTNHHHHLLERQLRPREYKHFFTGVSSREIFQFVTKFEYFIITYCDQVC